MKLEQPSAVGSVGAAGLFSQHSSPLPLKHRHTYSLQGRNQRKQPRTLVRSGLVTWESLCAEAGFDMGVESGNPETHCPSPRTLVLFRLLGPSAPDASPGTRPARVITRTLGKHLFTQYGQKFDLRFTDWKSYRFMASFEGQKSDTARLDSHGKTKHSLDSAFPTGLRTPAPCDSLTRGQCR